MSGESPCDLEAVSVGVGRQVVLAVSVACDLGVGCDKAGIAKVGLDLRPCGFGAHRLAILKRVPRL